MSRRRPPLAGLVVIDIASYLTGPFAAMMLADLGATVVKVEPPGGDPFRHIGFRRRGVSIGAFNVNRGKHSVVIDLTDDAGRDRLLQLIGRADALVDNWRPGVAERLGLGAEVVRRANPRLIWLSITGYGTVGPAADEPVFDSIIQARSGLAGFEGDASPTVMRSFIVDKVTAVFAAQAVLAALRQRDRDGEGTRVELSMHHVAAYFNFVDLMQHRTFMDDDRPAPTAPPVVVRAADGWMVVAPARREHVVQACKAAGHMEWMEVIGALVRSDEVLKTLNTYLNEWCASRCVDDVLAQMRVHDVPAAPLLDLDQHLADPQVAAAGLYEKGEFELGDFRFVSYPARFDGQSTSNAKALSPAGAGDAELVRVMGDGGGPVGLEAESA
jgi:CoA:oxalate CoA-transferase